MTTLQSRNGRSETTINYVYNACHKNKLSINDPRLEMQHQMKCNDKQKLTCSQSFENAYG